MKICDIKVRQADAGSERYEAPRWPVERGKRIEVADDRARCAVLSAGRLLQRLESGLRYLKDIFHDDILDGVKQTMAAAMGWRRAAG